MPRAAIAACMRNEGMFLLEWVAYHRTVGFDDVVIITNDCDDGTDLMADRLAALGKAIHIRNVIAPGEGPQQAGMRAALAHPAVRACDWLLHIDADEFLNVTCGEGRVDDLIARAGQGDAIAILWRAFGDAGLSEWEGGNVLPTFRHTQARPRKRSVGHKTMFRPTRFGRAIDHMPKDPAADVRLFTAAGEQARRRALFNPTAARYRIDFAQCSWEGACINHYAIRTPDIFLMKNVRGDGMGVARPKYMLGSKFHSRHNCNEIEDTGILRNWPETAAHLAVLRSDPLLGPLEATALTWFRARRAEILTPERIAAWTQPASAAALTQ